MQQLEVQCRECRHRYQSYSEDDLVRGDHADSVCALCGDAVRQLVSCAY